MSINRRSPLPGTTRLTRALVLTAAATSALGLIVGGGTAQAVPGAPAEPPSKKDVKAQVDQLYDEAEQASEKVNAAQEYQKRLQDETGALQSQVAAGQEELNRLRTDLGAVAAAEYRAGGIDPTVQLMLSSDPAAYLSRARSLGQAAERQRDTLRELVDRQRRLDQRRSETTAKLAELEQVRRTLTDNKRQIQQRLASAQQLLDSLGSRTPRRPRAGPPVAPTAPASATSPPPPTGPPSRWRPPSGRSARPTSTDPPGPAPSTARV